MARLALEDGDDVTVISSVPPDVESSTAKSLVFPLSLGPLGAMLMRVLSRTAVGRNLARLTPLDGGHRMARAVMRTAAVHDAIRAADLVAVLERDGILTGWKAQRRWAQAEAPVVFGAAPAETTLMALRAGS